MYNEPAITGGGNFADALTGIVDETGARFANFGFDSSRRPVLTEHAGGANRYIFQSQATLDFRSTAYDAGGRPLSTVDPNGRVTTLTYDARGRLTERNVGGEATSYVYDAAVTFRRKREPGFSRILAPANGGVNDAKFGDVGKP